MRCGFGYNSLIDVHVLQHPLTTQFAIERIFALEFTEKNRTLDLSFGRTTTQEFGITLGNCVIRILYSSHDPLTILTISNI